MSGFRARRRGSPLLVLAGALVFSPVSQAHLDGSPMEANPTRHYYYWSTQSTQANSDPQAACTTYCSVSQSRNYYSHWFDSGTEKWKCQCAALSPAGAPGTIYTAAQGNELHCGYGEAFSGGGGGSCGAGGPSNCMARKGQYLQWSSSTHPSGFNVPTDETADGTYFSNLKGCSLRRVADTSNGSCWNVSYQVTGSAYVDEDGLPNAENDGASWPETIPGVCDPATGNPVEGGHDGSPNPGSGGFDFGGLLEDIPDVVDPIVETTEQFVEDTESWLDSLTDPETWDDGVFAGIGILWTEWNVFIPCGPESTITIDWPVLASVGVNPPAMEFTCADTERIRNWLGVGMALAFFFWLLNTALSMPKTGG